MEKLDGILSFLQSKQTPPVEPTYHNPETVAKIMQTFEPSWEYGEIELQAIDRLFNGTKWVLLTGGVGTGKTTLLRLFIQAYGVIHQKRATLLSTAKVCLEYGAKGESVLLEYERILLCLDDLGVEPKSQNRYGTVTDPIATLLFLRYESKVRTFCTTNLAPDALAQRYGTRLADRFKEVFDIVAFDGKSKR